MSREPILCVDDDEQARGLIVRMLSGSGHDCVSVANVEQAREALAERSFSVVLCDIGLPGASGLELVEELARTHPDETVARLGRAIECHDGDTGAHDERVGSYALTIALALGIDHDRAELLRLVSPLHDIGKIAIPAMLLQKPEPLSAEERRTMERHTEVGHDLLAGSGNDLLEVAATIAWTHHERWDGTGYPRRLAGEAIPLEGRIVAVADVFDALTSDRPYRRSLAAADARAHVAAGKGKAFDPGVVDAFLRAVSYL
jgi:putative two-component system response regulator